MEWGEDMPIRCLMGYILFYTFFDDNEMTQVYVVLSGCFFTCAYSLAI